MQQQSAYGLKQIIPRPGVCMPLQTINVHESKVNVIKGHEQVEHVTGPTANNQGESGSAAGSAGVELSALNDSCNFDGNDNGDTDTPGIGQQEPYQLEAKTEDLIATESDNPDEQAILEAAYQQINQR